MVHLAIAILLLASIGAPILAFLLARTVAVGFLATVSIALFFLSAVFCGTLLGFVGWFAGELVSREAAKSGVLVGILIGIAYAWFSRLRITKPVEIIDQIGKKVQAGPVDVVVAELLQASSQSANTHSHNDANSPTVDAQGARVEPALSVQSSQKRGPTLSVRSNT